MAGDLFTERRAEFSPCRRYRYWLEIVWDRKRPVLVVCMLNPSTADEFANDPTVERCVRRAKSVEFGGLVVVNAFAWRSTDPNELYKVSDPAGPENDGFIATAAKVAGLMLCGWGTHVERVLPGRTAAVLRIISDAGGTPHALKINADGSPQHPLYVGYDVQPVPYRGAAP